MKTILYDKHVALGAKMVDFGGWDMPLHYSKGVLHEHQAVRNGVGIFDVSHMGRVVVKGKDAEELLDYLSTNAIKGKDNFTATYTVWCNEEGGSVDDVIVYKVNPEHLFVIVNASNRQKDLHHLIKYAKKYSVTIEDKYSSEGILAVQGPKAENLISSIFAQAKELKTMHFLSLPYAGQSIILSRTGYTGCDGFEIYASLHLITKLWDELLEKGKVLGIEPIGLGARDTLRLEMGYALYGHELSDTISPSESVSAWTIKWQKPCFLGKEVLETKLKSQKMRHAYPVRLVDKGIAREGSVVYKEGQVIGRVTSGTHSPSLNQAIALIIVSETLQVGDRAAIEVRGNKLSAEVVKLPFYKVEKK